MLGVQSLSWCCRNDPDKERIWTNTLHHSSQIRPAVRLQQEVAGQSREIFSCRSLILPRASRGRGRPSNSQQLQWDFGAGLGAPLSGRSTPHLARAWGGASSGGGAAPQVLCSPPIRGRHLRPLRPGFDRVRTSPRAADHIGMHWPRGAQCSGSLGGFWVLVGRGAESSTSSVDVTVMLRCCAVLFVVSDGLLASGLTSMITIRHISRVRAACCCLLLPELNSLKLFCSCAARGFPQRRPAAAHGQPSIGFRTAGRRRQTADGRPQTADRRRLVFFLFFLVFRPSTGGHSTGCVLHVCACAQQMASNFSTCLRACPHHIHMYTWHHVGDPGGYSVVRTCLSLSRLGVDQQGLAPESSPSAACQ